MKKEKKTQLGYLYSKIMANFEAFFQAIKLSINLLLFVKSDDEARLNYRIDL